MTKNTVEELAHHIKAKSKPDERFVIAISGFGGAGKTTTSDRLATLLGNTTIIHADNFIAANENGALEGYHLDWEKLEELVLQSAKTAEMLTASIYDWKTNRKVLERTAVEQYLILEGSIGLMQNKYKHYFDMTVWVDVPQAIANARGKKRDNDEYGVDHDELWDSVWGPREQDTFNRLQPDKHADVLLKNS